jgi:hypothetical protein
MNTLLPRLFALLLAFAFGVGADACVRAGDADGRGGRKTLEFLEDVGGHPAEFARALWVTVFDTDGEG